MLIQIPGRGAVHVERLLPAATERSARGEGFYYYYF